MKVLVTGFDPFGGESINPAWEAVKCIRNEIAGAEIVTMQIPTVVGRSIERIHEKMKELQPDMVISVGQAGGRFGVTPERVAMMPGSPITKETSPLTSRYLRMGMPRTSAIFP